jgi:sporulation protein YabP
MERNFFNSVENKISNSKQQKTEESSANKSVHRLELDNHKLLSVSGVKGVPVFNDKEVKVVLDGETLSVSGQNLEIKLLDLDTGKLLVGGYVTSLKYSSSSGGEGGFIKKLFK